MTTTMLMMWGVGVGGNGTVSLEAELAAGDRVR